MFSRGDIVRVFRPDKIPLGPPMEVLGWCPNCGNIAVKAHVNGQMQVGCVGPDRLTVVAEAHEEADHEHW
jgi:hypothetical protein